MADLRSRIRSGETLIGVFSDLASPMAVELCGQAGFDWAVLDERMSYIVNLFRGRQRDPSFDVHPFTADQLTAMRAGRVPDGPLLPPLPPAP